MSSVVSEKLFKNENISDKETTVSNKNYDIQLYKHLIYTASNNLLTEKKAVKINENLRDIKYFSELLKEILKE